ncbi:hypothetical protein R3W88_001890 [Solanum pinnatisectum]|uniref:RNase H type-1 domain-containing protein n=1 Tax=Solanum pinnatisectum TaxID=50273 RepID=A0AAV9MKV1_9SOLN|nr:hypothetical protein R3W88_001890 [Solanum pinnatisectum]
MKIPVVSKCYCYEKGEMETMKHILLTAPIDQKLWKQIDSCAGITINGLTLQQLIFKWWEHKASMLDSLQSYKPILHYQVVRWNKPIHMYCVRDMNEDLTYAKAHNIGETTNMEVEATIAWKALQFCLDNDLRQVRLETDSLALKNMIYRSWRIP